MLHQPRFHNDAGFSSLSGTQRYILGHQLSFRPRKKLWWQTRRGEGERLRGESYRWSRTPTPLLVGFHHTTIDATDSTECHNSCFSSFASNSQVTTAEALEERLRGCEGQSPHIFLSRGVNLYCLMPPQHPAARLYQGRESVRISPPTHVSPRRSKWFLQNFLSRRDSTPLLCPLVSVSSCLIDLIRETMISHLSTPPLSGFNDHLLERECIKRYSFYIHFFLQYLPGKNTKYI